MLNFTLIVVSLGAAFLGGAYVRNRFGVPFRVKGGKKA